MPIYRLAPSIRQTHRVLMDPPGPGRRVGTWKTTLLVSIFLLGGTMGIAGGLILHNLYGHQETTD